MMCCFISLFVATAAVIVLTLVSQRFQENTGLRIRRCVLPFAVKEGRKEGNYLRSPTATCLLLLVTLPRSRESGTRTGGSVNPEVK
ncbi:hypothetical protein V8F20_005272 [Naviculisporaceae sp. PSN 640]